MGRNWAITIGINGYDNLKPLKYAKKDAEAVSSFFRTSLKFEQIYSFSDDAAPIPGDRGVFKSQPTYAALSRFLRVRFEQRDFLNPEDNFWFFFAGHGKRYKGCDYLLPSDADPGDVERTALSIREIGDRLRRSGAGNVILLLDACRDEDDRGGQGIGVETQQGVVSIFSCSPEEQSYEIDDLEQGAFTYVLLQGLQIQGQGNCATVDRLDQYLRSQVPTVNRQYRKPIQHPYVVPEPMHKRHLILLPRQAEPADFQALKIEAFAAESREDWQEARHLWRRVLAVYPDGQAFEAIERIARKTSASPSPVPEPPSPAVRTGQRDTTPAPSVRPSAPLFEFEVVTLSVDKGLLGLGAPKIRMGHRPGKAEYRVEDLENGIHLELVAIPGGTFQMGSPDTEEGREGTESPQHRVTVPSFLMGKYPITQAQWKAVAAFPKADRDLNPDPSNFKGSNRPVEQVSWNDAMEFCARLSKKTGHNYRLPSEAEWEYACRAGTATPFHFGETITTDLANYRGTDWEYQGTTYPGSYGVGLKGEYREKTTEVGSFPPNGFGLYDMHGNVWEWCLDHWHENYEGAPRDGSAWVTGGDSDKRLLRGGSWPFDPWNCRSALRNRLNPGLRYYYFGFRVVCGSAWTL